MSSLSFRLLIAMILVLALTILPLPDLFAGLRPPWVLLLILYIQFFIPNYFRIEVLVIIGIILDVLLSTVIGEHAFALSLVTWVASSKARRFNFFSIGQQMALIGFFCLFYQIIIVTVDTFMGYHVGVIRSMCGAFIGMILWPWVRLLADDALFVKSSA